MKTGYSIGIDLGGSCVKAVSLGGAGEICQEANVPFDGSIAREWAQKIGEIILDIESRRGSRAKALGLSAPGLAARDGQSIAHMPGRLKGLEGLNWAEFLGRDLPVPVLNDAQAALLGEVRAGAARGLENVILFTLGTGVGGAAMVDGELLRGRLGRAGHLGHLSLDPNGVADVCGTPGSLEEAIGNCSIQRRTQGRFATTHALVAAAEAGDPVAKECWLISVKALAAAVASCINILDPEVVVIGGGIARAGESLFGPLRSHLAEMEWRPGGMAADLVAAELGEFAGAIGAAWNASEASPQTVDRGPTTADKILARLHQP